MPRGRAPRAMSMLEVVAAVAILALVTATITTAINYMVAQNGRERRQLACMEMANRLILMFLDLEDEAQMPSQSLPLPTSYGGDTFMYSMGLDRVTLKDNRRAIERQSSSQRGGMSKDRVRQVTIRVWLHKDSQGRPYPPESAPSATLSRVYDPLPLQRSPDSLQNRLNTEGGIRGIVNTVTGGGQ